MKIIRTNKGDGREILEKREKEIKVQKG